MACILINWTGLNKKNWHRNIRSWHCAICNLNAGFCQTIYSFCISHFHPVCSSPRLHHPCIAGPKIWYLQMPPQLTKFRNPRMNLFHIPQCSIQNRSVHISILKGALWDMGQVHSRIFETGPYNHETIFNSYIFLALSQNAYLYQLKTLISVFYYRTWIWWWGILCFASKKWWSNDVDRLVNNFSIDLHAIICQN